MGLWVALCLRRWRHFDTPQIDRLRSGEIPSTKAAARSLPGPGKRLLDPVPGWWKLCRLASASPSFRRSMDLVSSDHSPCCGPLHNAPMPYFYVSASRSVPQHESRAMGRSHLWSCLAREFMPRSLLNRIGLTKTYTHLSDHTTREGRMKDGTVFLELVSACSLIHQTSMISDRLLVSTSSAASSPPDYVRKIDRSMVARLSRPDPRSSIMDALLPRQGLHRDQSPSTCAPL